MMSHDWEVKNVLRLKYNITSENYDELYSDEQVAKYEESLEALMESLREVNGRGILCDIGCGTLLFRMFIQERDIEKDIVYYVGLDLSEGMLARARRRVDALSDVVQADAEHLPLRRKTCSVSVSYTVIDLLPAPEKMLSECRRVTRTACIISSLKKAQRVRARILRVGQYIGETDKDIIFVARLPP